MCTRYYMGSSPELQPYVEAAEHSPLKQRMVDTLGKSFKGSGEVRPADIAAVIAPSASSQKAAFPMVWGYRITGISRPVVNARVESAKDRKSFSADWMRHRCVIPASYYFEWAHTADPDGKVRTGDRYAIRPKGSDVTFLAGLYRIEEDHGLRYPVFTVLTREPPAEMLRIHNRMPVILPGEAIDGWINPDRDPETTVRDALSDMELQKM